MLPQASRMRRSADFTAAVRRGRRAGRPALTLHLRAGVDDAPALVGFVVSRAVGGSVVRNRVERRLRHVLGARLHRLPAGARLVVRASPASAAATSEDLARDVDAALRRLLGPV